MHVELWVHCWVSNEHVIDTSPVQRLFSQTTNGSDCKYAAGISPHFFEVTRNTLGFRASHALHESTQGNFCFTHSVDTLRQSMEMKMKSEDIGSKNVVLSWFIMLVIIVISILPIP